MHLTDEPIPGHRDSPLPVSAERWEIKMILQIASIRQCLLVHDKLNLPIIDRPTHYHVVCKRDEFKECFQKTKATRR